MVISGEFAGRFFGRRGVSLSLQELEEASCNPRCAGLFHRPREVFLLACNTLASKDTDSRTPEDYLRVLLDHGFDRAAAERVVALRYGPLGPSFRESLRRIFAGVPRIYGFSSVAPLAATARRCSSAYLRSQPDYRTALAAPAADGQRNRALLGAFAGTALVQSSGMSAAESEAPPARPHLRPVRRKAIGGRSPAHRLRTDARAAGRPAFVPHVAGVPVAQSAAAYGPAEKSVFAEIRGLERTRATVVDLVRRLDVSALQLELAHFAALVGWLDPAEFHALAHRRLSQLLRQQRLAAEEVDIVCEITTHESLRQEFDADDIPTRLYGDPHGVRLISCLAPADTRIAHYLLPALSSSDPVLRQWTAYALTQVPRDDLVMARVGSCPTCAIAHRRSPAAFDTSFRPSRRCRGPSRPP